MLTSRCRHRSCSTAPTQTPAEVPGPGSDLHDLRTAASRSSRPSRGSRARTAGSCWSRTPARPGSQRGRHSTHRHRDRRSLPPLSPDMWALFDVLGWSELDFEKVPKRPLSKFLKCICETASSTFYKKRSLVGL